MRTEKTNTIALNAVLAALYIALTLLSPFSFGTVNFRIADAVQVIACINKRTRGGISIGMAAANLFSPFGLVDVLAAVIICVISFGVGWAIPSEIIRVWLLVLVSALVVGAELCALEGLPFWMMFAGVFLSETILCWAGYLAIKRIPSFYGRRRK